MTFPELLRATRRWWWIVLLCPVVAAGAAYYLGSSGIPNYEARTTAIVEHDLRSGELDLQSIRVAEHQTRTLTQLATSRPVLVRVIEENNLRQSVSSLRRSTSVSHIRDTQLITISVQDRDPERAALIANSIVSSLNGYVREIQLGVLEAPDGEVGKLLEAIVGIQAQIDSAQARVDTLNEAEGTLSLAEMNELNQLQNLLEQLEQAETLLISIEEPLTEASQSVGTRIGIIEPALPPSTPVSPPTLLNTMLGGILGIFLAGGLVILLHYRDDKLRIPEDLARFVERSMVLPVPAQKLADYVEKIHLESTVTADIFQGLRTNLDFVRERHNVKSLVVTSSKQKEGKSTIAANLAAALAEAGRSVVLIDADLRHPSVHTLFAGIHNYRGLSNLLLTEADLLEVLQPTSIRNLRVVTSGTLPLNPSVLMSSTRMEELVSQLEEAAECVIFDTPPSVVSDTLSLAALTDGVLFIVRSGQTTAPEFVEGLQAISRADVPVLGVVLNGVPFHAHSGLHVYEQYYSRHEKSADTDTVAPKQA